MMRQILLPILAFALTAQPLLAQETERSSRVRPNGAAVYQPRPGDPVADASKVDRLLALDLPGGGYDPNDRPLAGAANGRGMNFLVKEKPVSDVFRELRVALRRNILVDKDVTATWGGDLYSVEPEEAIELICRATGLVAKDHGSYIQISNRAKEMRVFTVRHLPAGEAAELIKPALSEGTEANVTASKEAVTGLEAGEGVTGGDAYANDGVLVVRDFPENLDNVQRILDRIDRTPKQVMVEVMVISATLGATEQLGINFDALGGVNYEEYGATSGDGHSLNNNVFSAAQLSDGLGRFSSNIASTLATRGSQFGFITNGLSAFVRALSEKTSVSIHANTSVFVLNKQFGNIKLNNRDGFKTLSTNQNGTESEEVEFLETGSTFKVRPFIMDHGLVRMEIQPEDSDGGINANGLPEEETANLTSNVAVRDGQTLVIGGLFREKKIATNGKVPGLGDVPGVGAAFRSKDEQVVREELIFLITPRIIDLEAEAKAVGLNERHPHERRGGDRAVINELYARTARALVLEAEYGCALSLLEVARHGRAAEPKDKELQSRIARGLVPEFAARSVDARLLDELKAGVLSNR
ncbi:MAG: hypothetical protein CMJ94_02995 [Planctomycetes bacterium]|nr:hypothetical protein [Planctomycetota bacterium]